MNNQSVGNNDQSHPCIVVKTNIYSDSSVSIAISSNANAKRRDNSIRHSNCEFII